MKRGFMLKCYICSDKEANKELYGYIICSRCFELWNSSSWSPSFHEMTDDEKALAFKATIEFRKRKRKRI